MVELTRSRTVTLITVRLRMEARWAVAAPADPRDEGHLPVHRDPRAQDGDEAAVHVPATSLAGALREHLGESSSREWLGAPPLEYEEAGPSDQYHPGALWLVGVTTEGGELEGRGRTTVDPETGAARGGGLWSEQAVAGGRLVVAMEHAGEPDPELLSSLQAWAPTVGRGRSIGMGRARVESVEHAALDLTRPAHLTWWLEARHDWPFSPDLPDDARGQPLTGLVEDELASPWLTWTVREPIHVAGDDRPEQERPPGAAIRMLRTGDCALVPGSSWKGVYRHRVQVILRATGASDEVRAAIEGLLFGSATSGRGRLQFEDSTVKGGPWHVQRHVAIDRFTGGARDGALFALEAIPRGTTIDQRVVGAESLPASAQNLLLHVVRDLHDGIIGIGGSGARGYGWLTLSDASRLEDLGAVAPDAVLNDLLETTSSVEKRPS